MTICTISEPIIFFVASESTHPVCNVLTWSNWLANLRLAAMTTVKFTLQTCSDS